MSLGVQHLQRLRALLKEASSLLLQAAPAGERSTWLHSASFWESLWQEDVLPGDIPDEVQAASASPLTCLTWATFEEDSSPALFCWPRAPVADVLAANSFLLLRTGRLSGPKAPQEELGSLETASLDDLVSSPLVH